MAAGTPKKNTPKKKPSPSVESNTAPLTEDTAAPESTPPANDDASPAKPARKRNTGILVVLHSLGDGEYNRVLDDQTFESTADALSAVNKMHVPVSELQSDVSEITNTYVVARLVRAVKLTTKAAIEQIAEKIDL